MFRVGLVIAPLLALSIAGVVPNVPEDVGEPADYQPRHVHLAYGATTDEMVVTWSTLTDTQTSEVFWGQELFDLRIRTEGRSKKFVDGGAAAATQFIHRVHLKNLEPDTTYYYQAGSASGYSSVFGFKTVPAGTTGWPLRIALFGDMAVDTMDTLTWLQKEAHQGMYDAVFHVGDLAYQLDYEDGAIGDRFMEQIEPVAAYVPYMTCPGNHENAYDFSNYRARFSMPNYEKTENIYYSFDMGPVHFVSISTELYYFGPDSKTQWDRIEAQYEWLQKDLQEASSKANRAVRPWIIIYNHKPMYCSTSDDYDICPVADAKTRVGMPDGKGNYKYPMEPLLVEYGVDLFVGAHEHNYERIYPIYNYTTHLNKGNPYHNPKAPVHIVTGSAGCHHESDPFIHPRPEYSAKRLRDFGYTRIQFLNTTHMALQQIEDVHGNTVDEMLLVREVHDHYPDVKR